MYSPSSHHRRSSASQVFLLVKPSWRVETTYCRRPLSTPLPTSGAAHKGPRLCDRSGKRNPDDLPTRWAGGRLRYQRDVYETG